MLDARPEVEAEGEAPGLPTALLEALAKRGSGDDEGPTHALPPKPDRTNAWLWLLVVLCSGFVGGTTAAFSATASDTGNVFGSASLSKPASQDVTAEGNNLVLDNGPLGAFDDNPAAVQYGSRWRYFWPTGVSSTGTAYNCPSSTSSYTTDLADSSTDTKTIDYTTVNGFADGRWMCVMGHTAFPATRPVDGSEQWYSQIDNPVDAVLLGHVVQSVDLQDGGGTANTLQQNDRIVITFNQPVEASNRPTTGNVCARGTIGRIWVGPAKSDGGSGVLDATPACSNTPLYMKALYLKVQGTTTIGTGTFDDTTWVWSNGGRTLTITINDPVSVAINCTGGGCVRQWRVGLDKTFSPSTTLESATGGRALCASTDADGPDNGSCEPTAIGSF